MESGGIVDGGHGGGMKAQPEKEGRLCHLEFSEQQTFAYGSTDIVQPSSEEEISEHPDDNRQEEDPVHNYIPVGA